MFNGKKVSLIFPAFNEEKNIGLAVREFKSTKIFDEILVIDNNSVDRTAVIAKKFGAKVIKEKKQGYGFALRRGMAEAKGEYVLLCEPDGTFRASDCTKLLRQLKDFDFVTGTRTNRKFISSGANMKGMLRMGNIVLAKLTQILYGTGPLSDCGCTFRVMKKAVVKKILPHLTIGGSHLLPEMTIAVFTSGFRIKEIPVHYGRRVGQSKITGSLQGSVKVGVKMFLLVVQSRFK